MKSYTDLEQSKTLEKILPIESADMYYQYVLPQSDKIKHTPEIGNPKEALEWYNKGYTHFGKEPLSLKEYCIPCWSLAALLNAVDFNTINLHYDNARIDWVASATIHDSTKHCTKYESTRALNPVDACCEIIIKLREQKLL